MCRVNENKKKDMNEWNGGGGAVLPVGFRKERIDYYVIQQTYTNVITK